jgi:hypothetical protein
MVWNMEVKTENYKFLTLYCAANEIEKNEMGGVCSVYREGRGGYRVLLGKPEGKRPLGRPRRRWDIIFRRIFRQWDVGV